MTAYAYEAPSSALRINNSRCGMVTRPADPLILNVIYVRSPRFTPTSPFSFGDIRAIRVLFPRVLFDASKREREPLEICTKYIYLRVILDQFYIYVKYFDPNVSLTIFRFPHFLLYIFIITCEMSVKNETIEYISILHIVLLHQNFMYKLR